MKSLKGSLAQTLEARPSRRAELDLWFYALLTALLLALLPGMATAASGHDTYAGDTQIFQNSGQLQPNVLIIYDTSGSMKGEVTTGPPYDPGTTYSITNQCTPGNCNPNTVYKCDKNKNDASTCKTWKALVSDVVSVDSICPALSADPYNSLTTNGQFYSTVHQLDNKGNCSSGNGSYALGNWINWWQVTKGVTKPKFEIAREVVTNLISSTVGVRFGVMIFNERNDTDDLGESDGADDGGRLITSSGSISNGYVTEIKDMDAIFNGSTTNRQALMDIMQNQNVNNGWTQLAESQFEAMRYFQGGQTAFNGSFTYTSPMQASCQKNYVIIVTDGMSLRDSAPILKSICNQGDCDGDGFDAQNDPAKSYSNYGSDYLDDVAKFMYDSDLSTVFSGKQNVITYTVGFGLGGGNASAVALLQETAQNGSGQALLADDQQELSAALTQILVSIFEANTSFVSPVVPVSPDNKTYSGSRVYMGFFKPKGSAFWSGNMKKYEIESTGTVLGKDGTAAIDSSGVFIDTSISFWSTAADGGNVEAGGVGESLLNRDFSTNPRKIYTYMGTTKNLTDPDNAFASSNNKINPGLLDISGNEKNLIDFIHGIDTYDWDLDGNITEKRDWILGDILHSSPKVVSYATYPFNATNEADCSQNKTMIYVGANDGMLHAFRDCDASEAWAFIPQDLLPNLQYLRDAAHTYYVDATPSVYIYDADKDGNIETADGDKVILVFGERRGGGFYYALDLSNPDSPQYLWRLSGSESPSGISTDYSEIAQSWSEPEIAKVKLALGSKVVAIIGAGYDNANEDGRYGSTQTFDGTGTPSDFGEGNVTSSGTSAPLSPKGRGVYVVEIASLDANGVPSFATTGHKVWGFTTLDDAAMNFSIPSTVTVLDRDSNGTADRFYVGDTGGNMWRFDIKDLATFMWTGRKIFSANPGVGGATDIGRKIFYKPSVVLESGHEMLFYGTGDRAHPLNEAVMDRLYALKDKDELTVVVEQHADDDHELVDVTINKLQGTTTTSGEIETILTDLDDKFGWFIKLDERTGEKVLAPALAFTEVYYTTFAPADVAASDPCAPSSQLTSRVYVVNQETGEAVFNFDIANDATSTSNTRVVNDSGEVLMRSDRILALGSGIPSGVVMTIMGGGDVVALVGCGGSLCNPPSSSLKNTFPIYWKIRL